MSRPEPAATVEVAAPATTMRAWRVQTLAEPAQALSLEEVPVPAPGPGEVLLRIRAVAANFPDVLLCRGEYQVKPDLPFSPGIEAVGTIAALGEGVTGFALGDRVIGSKIGLLSEYATIVADDVWRAPESLDDIAVSGLTVAYQTAWFGL